MIDNPRRRIRIRRPTPVVAAVLLALSACTGPGRPSSDCPPGACRDAPAAGQLLRTAQPIGLTFLVQTFAADGSAPVTAAPTRRYFIDLNADPKTRTVRTLTSVAVDGRNVLVERTRWRNGWTGIHITDARDCVERTRALPTRPGPYSVVEDMVGSLEPSRRADSRRLLPGVYEYRDQGSLIRLTVGDSHWRGRTLEIIGTSGAVMSRTSDMMIRAGSAIPDQVRDLPCRPDPAADAGTLAPTRRHGP